jgi:PAS domain S-box-containing protein
MDTWPLTLTAHYQAALTQYLAGSHLIPSEALSMLCHQARQANLSATDWLRLHQQVMADLDQESTPSVTQYQQAHAFLLQCLETWDLFQTLPHTPVPQPSRQPDSPQLANNQTLDRPVEAWARLQARLRQEMANREYLEFLLWQTEERFYKLSVSIPGVMFQWVRLLNGQIFVSYMSDRCYDILQLNPDKVYPFLSFLEHIPAPDVVQLQQALDCSAQDLSLLQWEGSFMTRSGQHKWLQITSQPSQTHQGEVIWDGILCDVTAHRRAEIQKEQQAQQYQNLVSNVPGVIYRCTDEANWPIQFVSEEIATITGYPLRHFLQGGMRTLDDITHPDDQLMLQTAVDVALQLQKPYQIEYRIITASGDLRWVLERGQGAWDETSQQRYLDGVIIDINDLKVAADHIQASLEEKEVLLKEVHHRVKNNLNVVYSMLEMQGRRAKILNSRRFWLIASSDCR